MLQKGFTFDEKLFFCQNPLKPKRLDVGVFTRTRINNNDDIVGERKKKKKRITIETTYRVANVASIQSNGMVRHRNFITDNFGLVQESLRL